MEFFFCRAGRSLPAGEGRSRRSNEPHKLCLWSVLLGMSGLLCIFGSQVLLLLCLSLLVIARIYSMNKFVTHEAVTTGWFNLGHSSSTASMSHWGGEL